MSRRMLLLSSLALILLAANLWRWKQGAFGGSEAAEAFSEADFQLHLPAGMQPDGGKPGRDIFHGGNAAMAPQAARPKAKAPAAVSAQPLTPSAAPAPGLAYRLAGVSLREGKRVALLSRGAEWISAEAGEKLEGGFELKEILETSAVLKDLASGAEHTLEVSAE